MRNYLQVDSDMIYHQVLVEEPTTIFHWSRRPGDFLDEKTGILSPMIMEWSGNVREWYEGLTDTISRAFCDMTSNLHGDGMARGIVVSPLAATIIEFSLSFRTDISSPKIISRGKFAMIGFLRGVPVYVINTSDHDICTLFVMGCDLCKTMKVGRVSIAHMNV